MNVYIAEEAGFCFGVKRALNIINQFHEKEQDLHIYGQLIHNRTVLEDLKSRGIDCIESLDQLDPRKKLVIRTHGIPKNEEARLKLETIDYADATCPLVKKLHRIIDKLNEDNTKIIIVGNENHPEIIAAKSYAKNAVVIDSIEEADKLRKSASLGVIAQTTLDSDHYKGIVARLVDKAERLEVFNTICIASKVRQNAIRELAPKVDFVVVVGGKNSSNTKKLFDISLRKNKNSFHIESHEDLLDADFIDKIKQFHSVGITAGASTPPEEIEKVKNILENI